MSAIKFNNIRSRRVTLQLIAQKKYNGNNKEKIKAYNKKYQRDNRVKIIKLLGGKCEICEITQNLHLHHISYTPSSVHGEGGCNTLRVREALKFPERFQLKCRSCHLGNKTIYITLEWEILK